MRKYKQIIIGVDQSYADTGISVVCDGVLTDIKHVQLDGYKHNSEKRKALSQRLDGLLIRCCIKADSVVCICERARLHGGPTSFINIDAIKAMGALTACIVDVCFKHGVDVYSVDTRCWKSQVVGTCKPEDNDYGVPPEKWPTIRWVVNKGMESKILVTIPEKSRKRKGTFVRNGKRYHYNDNAADSAGIAMFGVLGDPDKLQLER